MASSRKGVDTDKHRTERERRDQEVIRARKELAAYFRGDRTEREARAALKTIKAFIRDRERTDAARRAPLPGVSPRQATARRNLRRQRAAPRRPSPAVSVGESGTMDDTELDMPRPTPSGK
jgi:hypothetical protein